MKEPAGAAPRFLVEPETVIVEAVSVVEPGMDPREVARVVRLVLATRTLQRRVARALDQGLSALEPDDGPSGQGAR